MMILSYLIAGITTILGYLITGILYLIYLLQHTVVGYVVLVVLAILAFKYRKPSADIYSDEIKDV